MKVTPIKRYENPAFPTRSILDERPELLRCVPKRWRTNPAVIAALTGMCALTLAARATASDVKNPPINKVAPVFDHGTGIGGFGCMSVNPPVFLSEDEARVVVLEEAKRAGINFKPDSLVIDNMAVPITDREGFLEERKAPELKKSPEDNGTQIQLSFKPAVHLQMFRLDGTDAKRNISFEYVSGEDFEAWEKRPQTAFSTAEEYEIKKAAEQLRGGLENRVGAGTVGVFYDPCVGPLEVKKATGYTMDYQAEDMTAQYKIMNEKAKQLSREELRKQVQDFIKWLKAEGVI